MSVAMYQIDAFSDAPFAGNPAAVCLMNKMPDARWMQLLAAENNLSETAYTLRESRDGLRPLRWFTPTTEVDLCGHATVATAKALLAEGLASIGDTLRFETASGMVTASLRESGWIELDFPALPPDSCDAPAGLLAALGLNSVLGLARNRQDLLVELESEEAVRAVAPNFPALARIDTRGVVVTARAGDGIDADFVSRFFAPHEGIDEDPVTGSAHCGLGPFWGVRLGKSEMVGYQASMRGGYVRVGLAGDRVKLGGQAAVVFRAELRA